MIKTIHTRESSCEKPNLLFISPTMPARTGSGSAMRAGCLLESLAASFNICLMVIPIYDGQGPADCSMTECCDQVAVVVDDLCDDGSNKNEDKNSRILCEVQQFIGGLRVDVVHVFRMILAPTIDGFLKRTSGTRPICILDQDEIDSRSISRIADLCEARQDSLSASRQRAWAAKNAALEREYLKLFDMIYIANEAEQRELADKYQCSRVQIVPNVIRIPAATGPQTKGGVCKLLFVGTMDYYPNQDAVMFFCNEVLPLLREQFHRPFCFSIVGAAPTPEVTALANGKDVFVTGKVKDLEPYYRDADLVVVPIRAGGGTRIKILEAFGYQRPVVSTSIGAEGLQVTHGRELLVGDTAAEFAAQCLALLESKELCSVLSQNALTWVEENHTVANVKSALDRAWSILWCEPVQPQKTADDALLEMTRNMPYAILEQFNGETAAKW